MKKIVLLSALLIGSVSAASAADHQITVSDFEFRPRMVQAVTGDTITWVWVNGSHTTTSQDKPSGARPWDKRIDESNPQFRMQVTVAGRYLYGSSVDIAQGMKGRIDVAGSATPTPTATATFTPTPSPTPSATATATFTPTPTPTATATFTPTPTATATFTPTPTPNPSPTPTATPTSTPTPTPTSTPGATVPRGVFDIANLGGPVPDIVLLNPDVDGISLRQFWSSIEPTEGVFDFSYLDSTIANCASHGKQVLVRIGTMSGRPAWVDDAVRQNGGEFFTFSDNGTPTTIPVFWDPTFLAKKKAFIAALGAHLTNNPTVHIVVASFANATSEDWNVPHDPDLIPQWLALGYTTALMVDAGAQLIGATMNAFPNQFVTLAEGGNGNVLDGPDGETLVARTAIDSARVLYPGRLIVQRNSLSTCIPDPPGDLNSVWNVLWTSRPDIGAQMVFQCFGDSTYTVNCGVPIDPALALMHAVDRGVQYETNYIEIYQTDVRNLPAAITYAHNLLNPP